MATEIERKYLVIPEKLPKLSHGVMYLQGYLSLRPHIRFRVIGKEMVITIKEVDPGGVSRKEWEFRKEIEEEDVEQIAKLAVKKTIKKIRYNIKYKGLTWEIDVYQGENEGLITAEVEIPRTNHPISFPKWINASQEVTNDPRYFNVNLGEYPFKSWQ